MESENMSLTTSWENITDSLCPSIDDFRSEVYPTIYSIVTVLGLLGAAPLICKRPQLLPLARRTEVEEKIKEMSSAPQKVWGLKALLGQ
ncbi:uncharacterized protein LOC135262905 isoform X2 [Anguilla rostrata]|uniref:uncharacterized protein LOC135262905 isoform X2 n=1 Tax=Anguilla rostrata TaxID=7938 RepID=UPI0030D41919